MTDECHCIWCEEGDGNKRIAAAEARGRKQAADEIVEWLNVDDYVKAAEVARGFAAEQDTPPLSHRAIYTDEDAEGNR